MINSFYSAPRSIENERIGLLRIAANRFRKTIRQSSSPQE
jgi:hypothetical protein